MKDTAVPRLTAIGVMGLALAGCGHHADAPPPQARASQSAHALQNDTPLDMQAFQSAAAKCRMATPRYSTSLSPECAKVAETALAIRGQYADGIAGADAASDAIRARYALSPGELPTSNAAAGLAAPDALPAIDGIGRYVGSISIGPAPGAITVTWVRGALAGDKLAIVAAIPPDSSPMLCWKVDETTTTVREIVQQLGPDISGPCN